MEVKQTDSRGYESFDFRTLRSRVKELSWVKFFKVCLGESFVAKFDLFIKRERWFESKVVPARFRFATSLNLTVSFWCFHSLSGYPWIYSIHPLSEDFPGRMVVGLKSPLLPKSVDCICAYIVFYEGDTWSINPLRPLSGLLLESCNPFFGDVLYAIISLTH